MLAMELEWERKQLRIETDLADELSVRSDPELLSLVLSLRLAA